MKMAKNLLDILSKMTLAQDLFVLEMLRLAKATTESNTHSSTLNIKKIKNNSFLDFHVPKCIPYGSFIFPPSA